MKRLLLLSLALVLLLGLAACSPRQGTDDDTVPTDSLFLFPEDTAAFGVKLEGLTASQALEALEQAVKSYRLTLCAGEDEQTAVSKGLYLELDREAFSAWAAALEAGTAPETPVLVRFDLGQLPHTLGGLLEKEAADAFLSYDEKKEAFTVIPEIMGRSFDEKQVQQAMVSAISAGRPRLSLDSIAKQHKPAVTEKTPRLQQALKDANKYLDLDLTYTYTPDGGKTAKQALTKKELASFLTFGKDLSVTLNDEAIQGYAAAMAEAHSESGRQGDFRTTGGGTVGFTVDYYGQTVDRKALAKDLRSCLKEGVGGTRKAPFHPRTVRNELPYGGDYVEINLTDQHLWVYEDGERVVSTPLVSGCVAKGYRTPTGIYSVEDRDTDCTLEGEDYISYVDYWVGFYGGYGIHDAPWRGAFGEDIYLYSGSHGCTNLPPYQAELVYEHTHLGMKVVVYGGETEVDPLQQEILCQDLFELADDAKPVSMGAKLRYEDEDEKDPVSITYQSSDPKVVTVSKSGKLTVKGVGEAKITMTVPAFTYHTDAKRTVTVRVHSACDEGRHQFGKWTVTKKPTCLPGEETRTCSKCGHTETREIPPAEEHRWSDWVVTKEPSCLPGEETRTCSVCGETETREIPPTGEHSWGEWITVTEPGCETPGLRKSVCALCGQERTEEIPPMGHAFSPDEEFCLHGCGTRNPDYKAPILPPVFPPHTAPRSRRWYQL